MIGLSAPLYDPLGHVAIQALQSSNLNDIERRVNRVKTLDGGVSISDGGHSAGDRTFRVRWKVRNESELRKVQRLVRLYPLLTVTSTEGVFIAAPEVVRERDGIGDLTLLIKEQSA